MGHSDSRLLPGYRHYLQTRLSNFSNLKIAWLGQQCAGWPRGPDRNTAMFDELRTLFGGECYHDFYDIANMRPWDANGEWNIKGYDLVLCFRLLQVLFPASHVVTQIKKTVEDNGLFVCDFVMDANIIQTLIRSSTGTHNQVIYSLPEYCNAPFNKKIEFELKGHDNLFDKQLLEDHSLVLKDPAQIKDAKNRVYILTKVEKEKKDES